MVSSCLRKYQNTCKISRGSWPRTAASLRRLTANLSWLLSSSRSKVSISLTSGLQLLLVMWRPQMTLPKILALTLCHVERAVLRKQPKHHPLLSHLFILRYFLLSAFPLLCAYFLAVSCYKRIRLTTSAYGTLVVRFAIADHVNTPVKFVLQIEIVI